MSRLKQRPIMPTFMDLIKQQTIRMDGESQTELNEPEKIIPVAVSKEILIPKFWPDMETIIQVPAVINWVRLINEFEYEAGITFMGKYPYNSDCSSIWKFKKIGDKFIPIHDMLNNY